MRLAVVLLTLLCLTAGSWAMPAFEVVKYGTLGSKQANADAVIMGDPSRDDVIATVKELVAHYRSQGFADVYVGCYRNTEVGRRMAVDEFYEPPAGQTEANWLCMYSKIGTYESIMFRPWELDGFDQEVGYYRSATSSVELGGTQQKPRYPAEAKITPVPKPVPLDPDQELFDFWVRETVRAWPGVKSLSSSKGCTLAVFDTYLTGKGAQALVRGLAADYMLRKYGIWTEAVLVMAELGSPISEISRSADDISAGICVVVVESSGQRHTRRMRPRKFLSPASN